MRWLIFVLVLCLRTITVRNQHNEACTTSTAHRGRCVLAAECEYALNILRSNNYTPEQQQFITDNECGKVPNGYKLICCPLVYNIEGCGSPTAFATQRQRREVNVAIRIHGGELTEPGGIPWAGVIIYNIGNGKFFAKCGCTLLNTRWVVTAAHCILDVPSRWKIVRVSFGEWDITKRARCTTLNDVEICRQEYDVEHQITHPAYTLAEVNMKHDIALLKTKDNVKFNTYVKPICLPFRKEIQELPIDQQTFTTTGWGETEKGTKAGIQRHVVLIGQKKSVCDKVYGKTKIVLSDEQLCIGGEEGRDSCRGDSGGPLIREHNNTSYLAGIVSFGGTDCAKKGVPGIYTNVIKYLDWIEEVMIENYS